MPRTTPEFRRPKRPGRRTALGTLLLGAALWGATPAQADEITLRDAWLELDDLPPAPGYAFYLRHDDMATQAAQAQRLIDELAVVARQAALENAPALVSGLQAWQQRLEEHLVQPQLARTPARADVATLLANPRHDPRLASLVGFGYCQPPAWVEVWHGAGISRIAYRPGMSVPEALRRAGNTLATPTADTAWLISPLGTTRELGIAAWNHQRAPVTPGSRLVVPVTPDSPSARWVDATLPHYLATRLPGDQCTIHTPPSADDQR